jgi:hypothetical protein
VASSKNSKQLYIYVDSVPNMEVEGCGCNAFLNDSVGISPFMSFIIAWIHFNEQGLSILCTHTTLWEIMKAPQTNKGNNKMRK